MLKLFKVEKNISESDMKALKELIIERDTSGIRAKVIPEEMSYETVSGAGKYMFRHVGSKQYLLFSGSARSIREGGLGIFVDDDESYISVMKNKTGIEKLWERSSFDGTELPDGEIIKVLKAFTSEDVKSVYKDLEDGLKIISQKGFWEEQTNRKYDWLDDYCGEFWVLNDEKRKYRIVLSKFCDEDRIISFTRTLLEFDITVSIEHKSGTILEE